MKLLVIALFMLGVNCVNCVYAYDRQPLGSLLKKLDNEIVKSAVYEQKKDSIIDVLRDFYLSCSPDSKEKYRLGKLLFKEYLRYNYDSAHHYLKSNIEWAVEYNDKESEIYDKLSMAYLYASTGNDTEAYMYMNSLSRSSIPANMMKWYYCVYAKLYMELYNGANDPESCDRFERLKCVYADSLYVAGLDPEMDEYWYFKFDSLFTAGNDSACFQILDSYSKQNRKYSLLAYIIAYNCERNGHMDDALAFYTIAAIGDIRSTTRDHGALPILASYLLKRGDVSRAYAYICYSNKQISLFNGKLRRTNMVPVLSVIEAAHEEMLMHNQHILHILIACISVLVIFLVIMLRIIILQLKKISKTRDGLKRFNGYLQKLNTEIKDVNADLEKTNKRLVLSDAIKEKYVTHFIQLCSVYIDNLDIYQRKVKKMALNRDVKGIMALAGSSFFNEELARLYSSFDDAFLHIYPNFVESLNELLLDNKRFLLKKNECLTTELRIYALIKLGVTDYVQIANFLRCSVNTVYNYRTKLRSRLKVSKEEFEAFLNETEL